MTFAGAVPGPDGQPLDQIRITGVTATGHHGVFAHERAEGQLFRADVVLHVDTRPAASGDDLGATVSYADVAQDVHAVLAGSPADLIETVAERIAASALAYAAVQAVDVRVHKPQAPIPVPFDDVEVAIRRDRVRVPVVAPHAEQSESAGSPDWVDQGYAEQSTSSDRPVVAAAAEPSPASAYVPEEVRGPGETTIGAFDLLPPPVPPTVQPVPVPAEGIASGAVSAPLPQEVPAPAPEPAPEAPVDPLDAAPANPVEVVIALGANLGDAQATLRTAVTDIDRIPGLQVTEVSPLARTAAVGGPDQPDFLNAVLLARTTLSPRDLLHACQAVEAQHGRVRQEHWGPRTLDVDIVQYGAMTATSDDLVLPHPRAGERAFVLVPWAEVAPHAVLVGLGGGPVAQLAATAPDRTGIRWLALDWLTDTAAQSAPAEPPAPAAPAAAPAPAPVAPAYVPPVQAPSLQTAPQQTAAPQSPPPAVPPTPPHGVAPAEPAPTTPQWHEPIPPAPEQQLAPTTEPPYSLPDDQRPLISDVPFQTSAPMQFQPVAEETFPPPPALPVRRVQDTSFQAPPVQQSFAPAMDIPFPAPPVQQSFPPVTDSPFPPAPDHPFPPSGTVPGGGETR